MTSPKSESDAQIAMYIERFKNCTAEELLRYMGEARDFFWKYMTPEGRKHFEATRFGDQLEHSDGQAQSPMDAQSRRRKRHERHPGA